MNKIGLAMLAVAAVVAAEAAPEIASAQARAEPEIVPLPLGKLPPRLSATEARAVLRSHGFKDIKGLARVGDYWESEGLLQGKPVVAYAFDAGALWIRRYPTTELVQAFGALPEASRAS